MHSLSISFLLFLLFLGVFEMLFRGLLISFVCLFVFNEWGNYIKKGGLGDETLRKMIRNVSQSLESAVTCPRRDPNSPNLDFVLSIYSLLLSVEDIYATFLFFDEYSISVINHIDGWIKSFINRDKTFRKTVEP